MFFVIGDQLNVMSWIFFAAYIYIDFKFDYFENKEKINKALKLKV